MMIKNFTKRAFCLFILVLMMQKIGIIYVYSQIKTEPQIDSAASQDKNETDIAAEDPDRKEENRKEKDIILRPITVKGGSALREREKDIQKVSRHTMTLRDLKEVPATFGDSINALTSLPGIIRSGDGLFGPLVIRGADVRFNNYYIDDIPIFNPLHYGGMHSIINNNLMSHIDLYASSFPTDFGLSRSPMTTRKGIWAASLVGS